ncbi:hypothetical protein [Halogeometricum limi]|uniref:hypothetical protein n=1 Tax=Halogeometricum limi TaxID=555875 RepID=UPI000B7E13A7|nr:hypothetical protein [Halogeometricum limi]
MSHSPDLPDRYVCERCHAVYAGTVVRDDDDTRHFEAPSECAACGSTAFVAFEQYVHADV